MKTRYIVLAFAALVASACAKEAAQINQGDDIVTITAWQEGSRSTLHDGGAQVYWEPEDAIKVFYDKVGSKFEAQCTSEATVSDFKGSLGFVGGGTESAAPEKYIWGLYPYRLDASSDGNSVTTTLPASQTGKAGSFATNTNITLARSESFGLAFYNVCGGVRFSLTQPGIKRVVLESLGGEAIAGTFTAGFDGGVPVINEVSDPLTKITLKAPDGGSFETGVWYYIVALPQTLSQGFKLTFRAESGTGTLVYDNPVTIKRGIFGSLANVDENIELTSGGGDDEEEIEIEIDGEFWDWANVKAEVSNTSGPYFSFKAASDSKYIYLYSKRNHNTALWGGSGYYYYAFDLDNNMSTGDGALYGNGNYEVIIFLYLFGGTKEAPAFNTSNISGGVSPTTYSIKNIICGGAYTSDIVETEIRIPRADLPTIPADQNITIYSWGNKSAETKRVLTCKL